MVGVGGLSKAKKAKKGKKRKRKEKMRIGRGNEMEWNDVLIKRGNDRLFDQNRKKIRITKNYRNESLEF